MDIKAEYFQPGTWTFLTNHAHVLLSLSCDPTVRIRDLAVAVGITERAVQGILSELEAAGYVSRVRTGRRNTYQINEGLHLRHPIEQHKTIADLIRAIRVSSELAEDDS
jgi:predicted ArsR family transcriptional regulator